MRRVVVFASCTLTVLPAVSQESAAARRVHAIAVYGEAAGDSLGGTSDPSHYGRFVYGGVLGGYYQITPSLGLDARGAILRSGNDQHQNTALFGPRFTAPEGRFTFDAGVLGGFGHAGYIAYPIVKYPSGADQMTASWGAAFGTIVGVNYVLTPAIRWRIGEIGFTHMFVQNGPTAATFGTGLVVRVF